MANKFKLRRGVLFCSLAMGGEEEDNGAIEGAASEEDDSAFSSFMNSLIDENLGTEEIEAVEAEEEGEVDELAVEEVEEVEEVPVVKKEVAPVEEVKAPVPEPVVKPAPAQDQPAAKKDLTPEEIAQIETRRAAAYSDLVREFEVSEDHANMLLTAPEKVMPELLAKVYHKAMTDSMAMMKFQIDHTVNQLPVYMNNLNNSNSAEEAAANEFYTLNPELKEHSTTVSGLLQPDSTGINPLVKQAKAILVSQGNANPSRADVMSMVGRAITGLLGVTKAAAPPAKKVVRSAAVHQPASPGGATVPVSSDSNVGKNETYISELLLEQ